ncbi:hypothetical protein OHB26_28145 [Nocardia sp. NBC_01503]|uniref:hypothetical protein n=1 Tax=Nocardia sp. NBC_01503 TaxID=2975997 RepID=UPI002E7B8DBB|nr:hypothetical protein [Nocardia sp. NBC_01503]WTL30778.1 hypothetical protein OHB26_28145 [Nocardia sp. NBC_01503]
MSRKATTTHLEPELDQNSVKAVSGADACWPEPSPLASWWEGVMFDDTEPHRITRDIA